MNLALFAGSANPPLARAIAASLAIAPGELTLDRFPDGELHVEIRASVRGADVYLVQPVSPPIDANLVELLLIADACRRAGAARLTAVIPYLGYARQDRRAGGREPVAARVVADLLKVVAFERVVAVDLHSPALEGFFSLPLEHLSAIPRLAAAVRPWLPAEGVLVAPDLGAAKLADRYARILGLPVALVHKTRTSGATVSARGVTGDVRGRTPIFVDDMISTGGTIEAAYEALRAAGAEREAIVVASHGLFVGPAVDRLGPLPLRRIFTTDSVLAAPGLALPIEIVGIADLIADAIRRLHRGESLDDLIAHR